MELELARKEKKTYFSFQHKLANEEIRDVDIYSAPFKEKNRTLLYSIIHDVTEIKRSTKISLGDKHEN